MTRKETEKLHQLVAAYVSRHQEETLDQMSAKFGLSRAHISHIARKHGVKRREGRTNTTPRTLTPELQAELEK